MSTTEILITLAGLYFGYWIVSKLIMDKPKVRPAPEAQATADPPPLDQTPAGARREPAWYETLNVSADATAAEIKYSYRTLMSQYHPDKVATLGEELKAVAERKSKEINAAYEEGMRLRGERT
jgi:DnaJ-domain-containing protein 1